MDRNSSPGLGPKRDDSSRISKPQSAAEKLAALKARVAAAVGTSQTKGPGTAAPVSAVTPGAGLSRTPRNTGPDVGAPVPSAPAGTGLNTALHPILSAIGNPPRKTNDHRSSAKSRQEKQPPSKKTLDLSGPSGDANPYYDPSLSTHGKARQSRPLHFLPKGVYIEKGNALRRQAKLEELKRKIQVQSRRVGLDDDDVAVEKAFLVEAPPEPVEWWDEPLVDDKDYDKIKDFSADTIVTPYIQHPVPLEPPQDKHIPAPKPMYLTKAERAKMRRQRRMAVHKEEQQKQRLGLLPTPEPKVKLKNMMRVMGDDAVRDPSKVEAAVRSQVAGRLERHLQTNAERKLTDEQRHEKIAKNQEQDAEKGLSILVFRIDSLCNGRHRYKININAQQNALTGVAVMTPKFSLVIVEGGRHSIAAYRKLMLNRINWQEAEPNKKAEANETLREWLKAETENGQLKSLDHNTCKLIFEGEVRQRAFMKWSTRVCETDQEARDALSRAKMENFWDLAKSTPTQ